MADKAAKPVNGTKQLRDDLAAATIEAESGFGYVWGQSTHAIGESFAAVGVVANTLRQVAQKGQEAAVYSRIEGSKELCKLLDIESSGIDCLLTSDAIVKFVCSRR
jgi:hypothetical protein